MPPTPTHAATWPCSISGCASTTRVAATPLAARQPAIPAYEYGRAPHAAFDVAFGDAKATAEADAAQTSAAATRTM
jgi:hypothetical protein